MKLGRLVITACVAIICIFIILLGFSSTKLVSGISLGLDLRGGASITLQVDFESFFAQKLFELEKDIKQLARDAFVEQKIERDEQNHKLRVYFSEFLKEWKDKPESILIKFRSDYAEVYFQADYIFSLKRKIIEDSISSLRRRIDEFGVREASIYTFGSDKIAVELPGLQDPTELKYVIGKTAKLTFRLIAHRNDLEKLKLKDSAGNIYSVSKDIAIDGALLANAAVGFDNRTGSSNIAFRFNSEGAKKFAKITKANTGRALAIILDDVVLTAPTIKEPILTGQGEISGRFTPQEAKQLALLLRSGALPAKLNIVEQRTIGPTLGLNSIKSAKKAAIFAICAVCLFMIFAYSWYGLIACIGLFLNFLVITAVLSLIGATLTLPGIAGLILTIGMAVDANVLIFERMREELKKKKSQSAIIFKGFESAKATILDSNITTLIAGFVILAVGSGPIKGFALTLCVGIFSSIFAALIGTRAMVELHTNLKNHS